MDILNLIRIKDWLKNIIIFFPLIFSGQLFNITNYSSLLLGFFSFCIISSFVYILNDILDIESDKKHPQKKHNKPIANNKISIKRAYIILLIFGILSFILIINQPSIHFKVSIYLFISFVYNFFFKKIPFLELIILAFGYIIRVDTGSQIIDVDSSLLMLISIFCLGLYFISIKRLSELNYKSISSNFESRSVLKYYKKSYLRFLSFSSIIVLFVVMLIYVLVVNIKLSVSFLLVIVFIRKYNSLAKDNSKGENPILFIFSDKFLLILSLVVFISSFLIYL